MLLITYRHQVARTAFGALAPTRAGDGPAPVTAQPPAASQRPTPVTVYAPNGGRFPLGPRGDGRPATASLT